jgi:hypothetical protein
VILVVLHVGPHDTQLAIAALEASARLEGRLDTDLWLFGPEGFYSEKLAKAASQAFSSVSNHDYVEWFSGNTWPTAQNYIWQYVARYINSISSNFVSTGWLWWEADAVPIRKGWLATLTDSHERSKKLFTGHAVRNHTVQPYMNGVGIWPMKPIDALQNCTALYTTTYPFDIAAGQCVMSSFNDASHLMIHERKSQGGGPGRTFNATTLKGFLLDYPQAVFYHGCTDGSLHALVGTVKEPDRVPDSFPVKAKAVSTAPVKAVGARRYIHCVERHIYPNQLDNERVLVAFNSWVEIYKTGRMIPCHVWQYSRDSRALGDPRGLPYLKDILIEGMTKATEPNDIILLSNDDTIFHQSIVQGLNQKLELVDAIGSMRLNFRDVASLPRLDTPLEKIIPYGATDLGRDVIAFKKSWLLENWHLIPDFVLGELEWDVVLAVLIRRSAALVTDRTNILQPAYECELPRGYVLHLSHDRAWIRPENLENPAKHYNRNLAHAWYKEHFPEMLIK